MLQIVRRPASSGRSDLIVRTTMHHPALTFIEDDDVLGIVADEPVAWVSTGEPFPRLYIRPSPEQQFVAMN